MEINQIQPTDIITDSLHRRISVPEYLSHRKMAEEIDYQEEEYDGADGDYEEGDYEQNAEGEMQRVLEIEEELDKLTKMQAAVEGKISSVSDSIDENSM